jgi:PTS system nitrogen regulatory IIA component
MKLTDILVRDACRVDLHGANKVEILRELAEALARQVPSLDPSKLHTMLLEREKLGTTAMGDGIAIPHARIESLDRLLAACGDMLESVELANLPAPAADLAEFAPILAIEDMDDAVFAISDV